MSHKFVTHDIICIALIEIVNEAHRQLVVDLFLHNASDIAYGSTENLPECVYCENGRLTFCVNATERAIRGVILLQSDKFKLSIVLLCRSSVSL